MQVEHAHCAGCVCATNPGQLASDMQWLPQISAAAESREDSCYKVKGKGNEEKLARK